MEMHRFVDLFRPVSKRKPHMNVTSIHTIHPSTYLSSSTNFLLILSHRFLNTQPHLRSRPTYPQPKIAASFPPPPSKTLSHPDRQSITQPSHSIGSLQHQQPYCLGHLGSSPCLTCAHRRSSTQNPIAWPGVCRLQCRLLALVTVRERHE